MKRKVKQAKTIGASDGYGEWARSMLKNFGEEHPDSIPITARFSADEVAFIESQLAGAFTDSELEPLSPTEKIDRLIALRPDISFLEWHQLSKHKQGSPEATQWFADRSKSTESEGAIKHDGEKPDVALVSSHALEGLAKVLTFGSKKYRRFYECDCYVSVEKRLLPESSARAVTTSGLYEPIQTSNKTNSRANASGRKPFQSVGEKSLTNLTKNTKSIETLERYSNDSNSHPRKLRGGKPLDVKYVEAQSECILTTTTKQGTSEESCVTPVTSASDSSKGQTTGLQKHSPTCASFRVKTEGAHNWRLGFDWSRVVSAAYRHLMAFNKGEDLDPESGLPHIDHLACCVMFLSEFQKTAVGNDDRYKGAAPK